MRRAIVKRIATMYGLVAVLTLGVVDIARGQDEAAQKKKQEAAEAASEREIARGEAAAERERAKAQAVRDDLQRLVPLSVDVTVTRFQGEKKISSMPYMLAVNAQQAWSSRPGAPAYGRQGPGLRDRRAARQSHRPDWSPGRTRELPGHRNQHRLHGESGR